MISFGFQEVSSHCLAEPPMKGLSISQAGLRELATTRQVSDNAVQQIVTLSGVGKSLGSERDDVSLKG